MRSTSCIFLAASPFCLRQLVTAATPVSHVGSASMLSGVSTTLPGWAPQSSTQPRRRYALSARAFVSSFRTRTISSASQLRVDVSSYKTYRHCAGVVNDGLFRHRSQKTINYGSHSCSEFSNCTVHRGSKAVVPALACAPFFTRAIKASGLSSLAPQLRGERQQGTFRQWSYAQAPKRVGCQSDETTVRQKHLLFAGGVDRPPCGRLPRWLMLWWGEKRPVGDGTRSGRSVERTTSRRSGLRTALRTTGGFFWASRHQVGRRQQKIRGAGSWHAGVVKGAAKFMETWHKYGEKERRKRKTKRN